MKFLDEVRISRINESYKKKGINTKMTGTIIEAAIRGNEFLIVFVAKNMYDDDIIIPIKITDLELVKDNNTSDDIILEDLPKNNPKWWCKVENGYIMNLLGEKKNKIPYDYNS